MTTYVLAGGSDRAVEGFGAALAHEINAVKTPPLRVLSCFFASPENEWDDKLQGWKPWLRNYLGQDMVYEVANKHEFLAQIDRADVVYFHGGDNESLIDYMRSYSDMSARLDGKAVVGSSAGANYLSQTYWTRTKSQVGEGAGLLPISVMTHYGTSHGGFDTAIPIDWELAEAKLRARMQPNTTLVKLREGELRVFTA